MSRYRPDPRYSDGNLPYRDGPTQRWDTDRFARERDIRAPPVLDRPPFADYGGATAPAPPRRAPVYEDERFYEDDRYGPRGSVERKQYYHESEYYDPRAQRGQMVPYAAPPRPGLIRRQSSLDTFDRQPARRQYDYDDAYRPARPNPPRELIPVPSPTAPPQRYPRYEQYYDDIRVQDPDYYGDDGFREYREREWVSRKARNSPSPDRRTVKEEIREEIREEIKEEKPYPRRGKTRMPKRLVNTKVLYDLGYPYYEEDERTIIIEKALGPDNIDEIFTLSKEVREKEVTTTRLIEAPPASIAPSIRAPSVHGGNIIEEKKYEKVEEIKTVPLSDAPRSVREWDALSVAPTEKSHRSRSRRRSRRGSSPVIKETIIEKEKIVREVSPARTHRTRRRGSSVSDESFIERKITREVDYEDSNSVHVGPLALVVDRKPTRSDWEIKEEIRRLEAERRSLRRERRYDRDGTEIIKVERVRERSPSPRGEVIIERRGEEILEVKKDRRGRARSAAPTPGMIRAMMATLT